MRTEYLEIYSLDRFNQLTRINDTGGWTLTIGGNDAQDRKNIKKEERMNTIDLFDNKAEDQKLLEEYSILDDRGCLTHAGWVVLGKLLLADKKSTIVERLKADKDSKKKTDKS